MFNLIDIIGWIGNICFILGIFLIAKKNKLGFISNITANSLYIWYGFILHLYPLISLSIILVGINIYGFIKWIIEDNNFKTKGDNLEKKSKKE